MACCCKSGGGKGTQPCLGRCDLPKHRCLKCSDVCSGPVPAHMGWDYTAKGAPEHQLRCGWRPGHIACGVLRKIEQHNCLKSSCCTPCSPCPPFTCCKPPPKCKPSCVAVCPFTPCATKPASGTPIIRIARHAGQYTIQTKPSDLDNSPSGPYPLRYVLNTTDGSDDEKEGKKTKYSIEAKFNDYQFDYTASNTSFVMDFSPPEKCAAPC